jgi:hypothetical protein
MSAYMQAAYDMKFDYFTQALNVSTLNNFLVLLSYGRTNCFNNLFFAVPVRSILVILLMALQDFEIFGDNPGHSGGDDNWDNC